MHMELKLRKVGNSVGLILPKEALSHLHLEEGDSVCVTEGPDQSLRLSPHKTEVEAQMAVARDLMDRYRHTLRELAK
jgi:putative addiction module antidote